MAKATVTKERGSGERVRPGRAGRGGDRGLTAELARLVIPMAQAAHRATAAGELEGHGVSLRQMQALWLLAESGPLAMGDLGRRLGIAPSTATELADRLVTAGYARRQEGADDRRRCLLHATAAGRAHAAGFRRVAEKGLRRRLAGMSRADKQDLLAAFTAMVRILGDGKDERPSQARVGAGSKRKRSGGTR